MCMLILILTTEEQGQQSWTDKGSRGAQVQCHCCTRKEGEFGLVIVEGNKLYISHRCRIVVAILSAF